jgi:hypothetical protein
MFRLNTLIANIRLAWIFLPVRKAPSYFAAASLTKKKKLLHRSLEKQFFKGKKKNEK